MNFVKFNVSARLVLISALISGLISCSGGGGGGGDENRVPAPAVPAVTVSGVVTYTTFNITLNGIEYDTPIEKPIRGAVIELQSPPGTVVASGNTSETGAYSLSAPANASVRILVKAALGTPASPDTKIVDNTSNGALYAIPMDITTATNNVTQSLNAPSGWTGSAYTNSRSAAPFAILDVIYQGKQLIQSVDSAVVFPPLNVNWSINNKTTDGTKADGDIGTSHYDDQEIALYILGAEDIDTDEYDSHVIAHEWGHYFEDNFSRSDSVGGDHTSGDILHPSVAFGEGYGYALAGMILNDPIIIDTVSIGQESTSGEDNLEEDSILDTTLDTTGTTLLDGYYSETSVQEVLYDIFDSGTSDDDSLALGFEPIYNALVDGQKNTESFTSIFSFLYHLKLLVPASAAAIDALAQAENINSASNDEFQDPIDDDLLYLYTTIDPAGGPITVDGEGYTLQTYDDFGPVSDTTYGNKIYNHRYFRSTVTTAGCYSLTVTPVAPTATADVQIAFVGRESIDINYGGSDAAETVSISFTDNEMAVFNVSAFSDNVSFSVLFTSTPSACTP